MSKLLVVGLENNKSDDPAYAMEPYTPNGAGERLWRMVNDVKSISREEYFRKIDFVNVKNAGPAAVRAMMKGRRVVVCGHLTWAILGLPRSSFWIDHVRAEAWLVPHPSGLTREYNQTENRLKTGRLIARLARL
jgi:hypothetical protein